MRFDNYYKNVNESIEDIGIFKGIFLGGHPGSGKSYLLSKVKSGRVEPRMVNVDLYPERKDPLGGHYEMFYDRSKKLLMSSLTLYINSLLPLACDTTSAQTNTVIRRYNILENLGYDLGMIFVNTSKETAWDRIQRRTRKVPRDDFEKYYDSVTQTKTFLKSKFPFFVEVNNDVGELTNEVILQAFRKVSYFYEASIKNPIGIEWYNLMRENGWKYLTPNIMSLAELKGKVSEWYSNEN
jgi:hypothetical protein